MDVTVMGRIGYDLFADQHLVPLSKVTSFSRFLGGSSANMAVGLARLGLDVGIHSCIGDDALGEYLLDYLIAEGVDVDGVQRTPHHQSSLCLTEVSPPDSFPQVFYRCHAADIQLEVGASDHARIASSRLFVTNGTSLCGSPSRESTLESLERARKAGVKTAFDVDYRAMSWESPGEAARWAREALSSVDVLLANPEELELLSGHADSNAASEAVLDMGVEQV